MDIEKIKQIVTLFENSQLQSMEVEIENAKIKMDKPLNGHSISIPKSTSFEEVSLPLEKSVEPWQETKYLVSPLVGTFYATNGQGKKPYVDVNQAVKKGDVICIVEAMKVMNEVKADCDGIIDTIMVQDGQLVEYNQPLFAIRDN